MSLTVRSGGQTGVDRAGLEVAREFRLPTGGWVPLGWRTDAGPDPSLADFGCLETTDKGYHNRTIRNVADADGTVLFGDLTSTGCVLTLSACRARSKPYLENPTAVQLLDWIVLHHIEVLNVAGNRQRTNPSAAIQARQVLRMAFRTLSATK